MRASFLLIFCFAALAFASDSKYAIRSDEFRLGEELRLNALMAIGEPGQKILSGKPDFSKKAELYMRRKIDGTNYAFYSGLLNPSPFKTFYAFDLEKNKITRDEALKMKFYAKRRTKPYRDETEIYFTDKYIFSPRLPVLYFMRNEEWQRLESVVAPGVLNVVSDEKKVLSFIKRRVGLLCKWRSKRNNFSSISTRVNSIRYRQRYGQIPLFSV
mgnify:CR=1 FL=1